MYMPSPGFETDSDLGGRKVLRHLFEIFISAGENWMESSIVINARSKTAKRRRGKFVWKKYCDLVTECLAQCICQ